MTPCSSLSFNRRFGETYRLQLQSRRNRFSKPGSKQVASLLAPWFAEYISSTLKIEAIFFSETSVETQRTTRRHIPEDETLRYYSFFVFRSSRLQISTWRLVILTKINPGCPQSLRYNAMIMAPLHKLGLGLFLLHPFPVHSLVLPSHAI
jgi:hypothetical protein